jgi:hypothetical protein
VIEPRAPAAWTSIVAKDIPHPNRTPRASLQSLQARGHSATLEA